MTLKRCANHTSEQLRNIGCVFRTPEGHHSFCTRAVPASGQIFFEKNNTNAAIFCDLGWLDMRHGQSVNRQCARRTESMHNFIFFEAIAHTLFDFGNYIVQIGVRYFRTGTSADLDNKHRIYIGVVLFIGILIPVLALILPFVCCSLENGHVTVFDWIFRISDYNTIFEQSRLANLGRGNNNLMQCRVCCLPDKGIKTLGSCTHSDNNRNGRQILLAAALDKTLHDGGCRSRLASLHTTMCLINNEIQAVSFFSCCIFNGLPNRILSRIRMAAQITSLAKLLRIQKIDMTVLQNLAVERFI